MSKRFHEVGDSNLQHLDVTLTGTPEILDFSALKAQCEMVEDAERPQKNQGLEELRVKTAEPEEKPMYYNMAASHANGSISVSFGKVPVDCNNSHSLSIKDADGHICVFMRNVTMTQIRNTVKDYKLSHPSEQCKIIIGNTRYDCF